MIDTISRAPRPARNFHTSNASTTRLNNNPTHSSRLTTTPKSSLSSRHVTVTPNGTNMPQLRPQSQNYPPFSIRISVVFKGCVTQELEAYYSTRDCKGHWNLDWGFCYGICQMYLTLEATRSHSTLRYTAAMDSLARSNTVNTLTIDYFDLYSLQIAGNDLHTTPT